MRMSCMVLELQQTGMGPAAAQLWSRLRLQRAACHCGECALPEAVPVRLPRPAFLPPIACAPPLPAGTPLLVLANAATNVQCAVMHQQWQHAFTHGWLFI